MSSVPTNDSANLVNKGLAIFAQLLRELADKSARAQIPWLNWPVVSTIFNILLKVVEKWVYNGIATQATFIVISFQTSQERDDYLKGLELLAQARQTGVGHSEALERMRRNVEELVRFNGVVVK